jgi:hypothetical protein
MDKNAGSVHSLGDFALCPVMGDSIPQLDGTWDLSNFLRSSIQKLFPIKYNAQPPSVSKPKRKRKGDTA